METKLASKPGFWMACFLASRPKTLTASAVPILLGTTLAAANGASIDMALFIFTVFSAIFIQIGVNFFNDALDFCKAADTEQRLGPDRATQKGWLSVQQVFALGFASMVAGLFCGIPLFMHGGFPIMGILILCAILGYFYTGGPYPLAYLGLGELLSLIFYGFVITGIPYYLQTLSIDASILLAGFQMGCFASVLILTNNLRDIHSDAAARKLTTAVRFGMRFARIEFVFFATTPFVANLFWFSFNCPFAALLPLIILPFALLIIKRIWKTAPSRVYNQYLGMAALLHCSFGLLLSLGLFI